MMRWLPIVGCLALTPVAAAAGLHEAETLYQKGALDDAANLARSVGGADGFALAAKATLVDAVYQAADDDKIGLLDRAAADARAALEEDPEHVDAHLQLAIALGHKADQMDPISAYLDGYAKDGKALIDRALALDPDNRWGRAMLGIWHLRVVDAAGDQLAGSMFGATRQAGIEHCLDALVDSRWDLTLKYGCAVALIEVDPGHFAGAAARALTAVSETEPEDAADRLVQHEAARILAELK